MQEPIEMQLKQKELIKSWSKTGPSCISRMTLPVWNLNRGHEKRLKP